MRDDSGPREVQWTGVASANESRLAKKEGGAWKGDGKNPIILQGENLKERLTIVVPVPGRRGSDQAEPTGESRLWSSAGEGRHTSH